MLQWLGDAWTSFYAWVAHWPDVAKGAAIGSLTTLLGMFVQNLFENRRHRQRLDHDAKQRVIEEDAAPGQAASSNPRPRSAVPPFTGGLREWRAVETASFSGRWRHP
jgi:hypothetical protein